MVNEIQYKRETFLATKFKGSGVPLNRWGILVPCGIEFVIFKIRQGKVTHLDMFVANLLSYETFEKLRL